MFMPYDFSAGPVPAARPARKRWEPPTVEPLGGLEMMTLQQSVPVGPGGFLPDPERTSRLA
jgi:hypothetical protein